MERELRNQVRQRAGDCCEYCRLRQADESETPFHVEHIIARQHGGSDDVANLALACALCNLLKGPNLSSLDPDTGKLTRLFHPRTDRWSDHLHREGALIMGHTDVGRTTAWLLQFNSQMNVEQRLLLLRLGALDD